MGFLKKLFRGKKKSLAASSSDSPTTAASSRRKLSRKEKKALKNGSFDPPPPPQDKRYSSSAPSNMSDHRPSEDYVRKPSFSSQRNSRSPHYNGGNSNGSSSGGGGAGKGSFPDSSGGMPSPNENRSPGSGRMAKNYDDNYNDNYDDNRDDGYNRHNGKHRSDRGKKQYQNDHQNQKQGMVQFGGENAFSSSSRSSKSYHDHNDENTDYSNSISSPDKSYNSHDKSYTSSPRKSPPVAPLTSPNDRMNRNSHNHNHSHSNNNQGNLQYDQLQQFDQQEQTRQDNNHRQYNHHPYQNQQSQQHISKKMLQLTRLPNGQLVAMDRLNQSSPLSASSEFDLSTDAEDNEYNHIRQRANARLKPMLEPQSPKSVSDDDENNIRNAQTNMNVNTNRNKRDSGEFEEENADLATSRSKHYFSDSDHESALNSPSGDNSSHSKRSAAKLDSIGSNEYEGNDDGNNGNGKSRFSFDNEFEQALVRSKKKSPKNGKQRPPSPTAYQKIAKKSEKVNKPDDEKSQLSEKSFDSALSPRALAIQAAQNMRAQGKLAPETYSDSTDSEMDITNRRTRMAQEVDLLPPRTARSQESGSNASSDNRNVRVENKRRNEGVIENFADFETFANNEFGRASKSVADPTSPVSELLAQAQARRRMKKGTSQSVNSEPALNATILRQQLKLPNSSRPGATNEAKKKLQQRRIEKEKFLQLLNEGKNAGSDDDSDKEKDVNETWLFDEVTGALGPRGIAADLESLGERSNRSKTSHRSHKSHRSNKSYRSHKSSTSHRRTRRSDESVGSRHSRSSRYSVKSTKSYVSQMSQESRSVANDLIRLEMQLAMVGSNLKNGENEVKKQLELDAQRKGLKDGISVGESSIGLKSYSSRKSSRKSSSFPKRAKINVKAPPGKLGIILANKTDSKGTVVSGVRTTSVLADKISPGDRIIAIDGEDVSRMSVPEITAIMARKNDFERVLTVLVTPQK